jgi:hypothetical protein
MRRRLRDWARNTKQGSCRLGAQLGCWAIIPNTPKILPLLCSLCNCKLKQGASGGATLAHCHSTDAGMRQHKASYLLGAGRFLVTASGHQPLPCLQPAMERRRKWKSVATRVDRSGGTTAEARPRRTSGVARTGAAVFSRISQSGGRGDEAKLPLFLRLYFLYS